MVAGIGGGLAGNVGLTNMLMGGQNPLTLGWNELGTYGKMGVVSEGLGALGSLANLYAGFKALRLQEKQFDFAKDAWNKNYNNQVKDYENTLRDRWLARDAGSRAGGSSGYHEGGQYQDMGSWVSARGLTGEAPGYRAGSAQQFFSGGNAQTNRPIQRGG